MKRSLLIAGVALGMAAPAAAPAAAPPARPAAAAAALADLEKSWSGVLGRHLSAGRVDYGALAEDPGPLDRLARLVEGIDPQGLPSDESRQAFWINAYNLLVVRAIVEHYPVASPRAIGGFFDRDRHPVAGRRLTLDEIEKKELLQRFRDPRFHFVLVCAALGCPPLIDQAYRAESLDDQLEMQTRAAINDDAFVHVDVRRKKIVVSKIFQWYRKDFEDDAGSLYAYLAAYRESLPARYEIEFSDYDWTLNDTAIAEPHHSAMGERQLRFTPSTLLTPDEIEVEIFNNLYTQTAFYDSEGDRQETSGRASYFTGIVAIKWGWRHRLNGGLDVVIKSVKDENFIPEDNPAFQGDSRTAVTSMVPNLQFVPFGGVPTLSVETGFLIPLGSDLDGASQERPFLDYGDPAWLNELFYDFELSPRWLGFSRVGAFFRFNSE
jgi:hypothetical protein